MPQYEAPNFSIDHGRIKGAHSDAHVVERDFHHIFPFPVGDLLAVQTTKKNRREDLLAVLLLESEGALPQYSVQPEIIP